MCWNTRDKHGFAKETSTYFFHWAMKGFRKKNNVMGADGIIRTQCSGEGVRVTTAIYQGSSPANTGKGACVICSPDPNIQSPLNASKKAKKKNNKSQ